MKDKQIEKIIPKLIGAAAMDYDLKEDGLLVVIDQQGKKRRFLPDEYKPQGAGASTGRRKARKPAVKPRLKKNPRRRLKRKPYLPEKPARQVRNDRLERFAG